MLNANKRLTVDATPKRASTAVIGREIGLRVATKKIAKRNQQQKLFRFTKIYVVTVIYTYTANISIYTFNT